ncbi:MAG: D-alanyl-D-alanine carboxypeptidase [Butyricicoccus pullicaecorum]|nr:D-alanyl-D-alanine carboxypeptidase [Butyricicoccus pullicaecorum]
MFVRLLCCALLTLLTLFCGTASAAPALQEPLYGAEAILYCAESGQTLYEKNADVPVPPASVTKLMTALIVLEQVDDLSKTVTVSDTAVQIEQDSTHIGLVAGEIVTLQDMLYATLMQSANDAANVLAEAVAGSQSAFSHMMNIRAAALGCTGSHFENAHGLDAPTHLVTARDLARITAALLEYPRFLQISGAQTYTMPATNKHAAPRTFYTKQRMLRKDSAFYNPYALAGKNGYTTKAQHTQVMAARKDGMTLIAVSLGASGNRYYTWRDMRTLFAYGFDAFHTVTLHGDQIAALAAQAGAEVRSDCAPVSVTLPVGTPAQALSLSQQANEHGLRTLQMTRDGITQALRTLPYPLSCDIQPVISSENAPSRFFELLIGSILTALLGIWFTEIHIVQKTTTPCRRYPRQRHHARHGTRKRF